MSHIPEDDARRVTVPQIRARKGAAPITAVTAYDYPSARLADEAGFDIVLVGDSLAQTALGYTTTLPVTLEEMIAATRAVRRGAHRALVVGDMPFGYYQDSTRRAVESAIRFVKEGGADAVKIEGGSRRSHLAKAKSVCHRCPVTETCLAWALETGQRYGVWGGLSEDERYELQRRGARISGRAHLMLISAPEEATITTRRPWPVQGA